MVTSASETFKLILHKVRREEPLNISNLVAPKIRKTKQICNDGEIDSFCPQKVNSILLNLRISLNMSAEQVSKHFPYYVNYVFG